MRRLALHPLVLEGTKGKDGVPGAARIRAMPRGSLRIESAECKSAEPMRCRNRFYFAPHIQRIPIMVIGVSHLQPIVALIAGILILIVPRLLNFIVAIYLIFIGVTGLGLIR